MSRSTGYSIPSAVHTVRQLVAGEALKYIVNGSFLPSLTPVYLFVHCRLKGDQGKGAWMERCATHLWVFWDRWLSRVVGDGGVQSQPESSLPATQVSTPWHGDWLIESIAHIIRSLARRFGVFFLLGTVCFCSLLSHLPGTVSTYLCTYIHT